MTQMGWGWIPELGRLAEDLAEQSDWQERALCAQTDPEAFYPEKGGSTAGAKRVCLNCEVKDQCLEYALAHQERFGIWGGLSERERRKLESRDGVVIVPRRGGAHRAQLSDEDTAAAIQMFSQGWSLKKVFQELRCSRAALERLRDQCLNGNGAAA